MSKEIDLSEKEKKALYELGAKKPLDWSALKITWT